MININFKWAVIVTVLISVVIMIAVTTIGCVDELNTAREDFERAIDDPHAAGRGQVDTPTQVPTVPISESEPEPELTPIEIVIESYLSDREYVINTKKGSEIYVCSHFGCDMTQALIDDGHDAGIVCDHTSTHILTWINLDGVRYVIAPQTGEYWTSDDYNPKHNVDYVSLSKGKEFAKESSEVLHR